MRQTINYWRENGVTPEEAMQALGVPDPEGCGWVEVEIVAMMRADQMAARVAERREELIRRWRGARKGGR